MNRKIYTTNERRTVTREYPPLANVCPGKTPEVLAKMAAVLGRPVGRFTRTWEEELVLVEHERGLGSVIEKMWRRMG